MSKIKIITDSTCDLPKWITEKYDIEVIPLYVTINEISYLDGEELRFPEMMEKIEAYGELPKTTQINPQRFLAVYSKYLEEGFKILSIHISSKLSGTYQSALIAKDMIESENIEVIDAENVTSGLGVLVLQAAKLNKEGIEIHELKKAVENLRKKVKSALMFDSLDNLIKGGRLSRTAGALGTVLNIKLIIEIINGELNVKEKVRGSKKAVKEIISDLDKYEVMDNTEVILLSAAGNPEAYTALKSNLEEKNITFIEAEVGCVVGTHSGKGACGYFFISK